MKVRGGVTLLRTHIVEFAYTDRGFISIKIRIQFNCDSDSEVI